MKKLLDVVVTENVRLNNNYCLLKLTPTDKMLLPDIQPGQFVEVKVEHSPKTFLRRPISVNFVDKAANELWLLIQKVGDGTQKLCGLRQADVINLLLPLGNTFSSPQSPADNILLIGGGVGAAPMLYWGATLKAKGYAPRFLLGARSKSDLLQLDEFAKYGELHCTTEDGSFGEKGYVTGHSILRTTVFNAIYACGPKPMMQAVARYAHERGIFCEVSLENTMACGFGVCLCCVENTRNGNVCVCTEGHVFNINDLKWID
ncbi:MAG: dihydroorotate dehydrogenase electron transfer subunit [Prevotella sp.]|nr:dihydroorotate dehydrogenase electron transfer subunit [Prevotella sp.]